MRSIGRSAMADDKRLRNDAESSLWFDDELPRWDEGDPEPAHEAWCPRPRPSVEVLDAPDDHRLDKLVCPECKAVLYRRDGVPLEAATMTRDRRSSSDEPSPLELDLAPFYDAAWAEHPGTRPTQHEVAFKWGRTKSGLEKALRRERIASGIDVWGRLRRRLPPN
jgi:hypothetical protein